MISRPEHFAAVGPDFYEAPERVPVDSTWMAAVRSSCRSDWVIGRSDIWVSASNPSQLLPPHGFKIHLSSVPYQARDMLASVASICTAHSASFKFAANQRFLNTLNSKAHDPGSSGKFITVYPSNLDHFLTIIADLYDACHVRGFVGPYILSDRRYRDSPSVYYRYGGIRAARRLQVDGTWLPGPLVGPEGQIVEDHRLPYFTPATLGR